MTLAVNDKVNVEIIENGYWKDSCRGQIVGETAKFWIVSSYHHRFRNSEKGEWLPRRFSKAAGNVSRRAA